MDDIQKMMDERKAKWDGKVKFMALSLDSNKKLQ